MQFLAIMIPAVYKPGKKVPADFVPPASKMKRMGEFNDEMRKADMIRGINGLHPLAKGARVSFAGGKPTVTDGPFIEAKEVVGGYWLLEARSKEEVVNWMKRCPCEPEDVIEIRQVFDMSDFPTEGGKS